MRTDRPIRYIKALTSYVHDPLLYRLRFAHRGVFWGMQLLSAYASDTPGWFIVNDEPMTLRDIKHDLHCGSPNEERIVEDAIIALMHAGLLAQEKHKGWRFPRWESEQAGYNRETPEESAARVRRWRAEKKTAKQIAAGQLETGFRIVPRDR